MFSKGIVYCAAEKCHKKLQCFFFVCNIQHHCASIKSLFLCIFSSICKGCYLQLPLKQACRQNKSLRGKELGTIFNLCVIKVTVFFSSLNYKFSLFKSKICHASLLFCMCVCVISPYYQYYQNQNQ